LDFACEFRNRKTFAVNATLQPCRYILPVGVHDAHGDQEPGGGGIRQLRCRGHQWIGKERQYATAVKILRDSGTNSQLIVLKA
jgi:hypothetical protein